MPLTRDMRRLLYAIQRYSTHSNQKQWLKLHSLHVIVHLGVHADVFTEYDLAPALLPFRGIKMFAMISQEAEQDLEILLKKGLIEKILLNSWFYSTVTAFHVSEWGEEILQNETSDDDRAAVDQLIVCPKCGSLVDFAVCKECEPEVHLVMHRVCRCTTAGRHRQNDEWDTACAQPQERIENFFSLGEVEYAATPFYL